LRRITKESQQQSSPDRVSDAGFTLIELLTVIAILGILTAIFIPVTASVRASARQSQCASNMRQIGLGLRLFADDNGGNLPGTSHYDVKDSWITSLAPYLGNVNEIRICPADPRAEQMRQLDDATSYVMNNLIFNLALDELDQPLGADYRHLDSLTSPSLTKLAFIEADHRGLTSSDDHTHAEQWANNWLRVINDIAPDRHRSGSRASTQTEGSANYLYADGHVASIPAVEIRRRIESGENIALPPEARK